ncbi:MAG: S24/S26 family peptidase [Eubacterium sp.]
MSEYSSIKEILDKYGTYTGLTVGTSMNPLLHEQKDNIIIVKPDGRLRKYDIALYVTDYGKYIMHRVVEVHDDHYIITGDNLLAREYVTDDMICGKLVGFYKNGKKYIDCENSKLYKFYSRVWVALKPLRPILIFIERGIWFIKRKVFKKK